MLESALKEQLKGIFAGLEADFTFDISVSASHESRAGLLELLEDVAECSSTNHLRDSAASVLCFSPGHFRRRTSRLVSCYALFECVAASEPTS